MDLIGQHDKDAEREEEEVPRVPGINDLLRTDKVLQGYSSQDGKGNEAVVTICFN